MDDWKRISHFDFCLLQEDNSILVTTCDRRLPAESKLEEFRNSTALCLSNATCCLYKITEKNEQLLLIVWGSEDSVSTIGELAVCQIESILESYAEKNDKNAFMQKLLLGNYTDVEAFNRARKLHISSSARRAVFLVETRQSKDEHALATIKNIFSARTHDFITSIDNRGIIVVRELTSAETYDDLENIAHMLVDMLGTEAMTQAFGYRTLGIGRLLYQLPVSICEMFIQEIFGDESLDSIDGETLAIIRTFFENNLNLSETSRQLYVHRNTLVYRFEKIQKRFGLDLRTFEDAMTFKLAMLVSRYLRYQNRT